MTIQLRNLEFNDFSGGITDKYLDSAPNTYQFAENFLISVNRKLFTRPGSRALDSAAPRLDANSGRVAQIVNFNANEALFGITGGRIYHYSVGSWTRLLGIGGNDLFPNGTPGTQVTVAQADRQIYLASSESQPPAKLIKTVAGFKSLTAGLPAVPAPTITGTLQPAYDLANSIKAKFNAHIINLAQHSSSDAVNAVVAPNATSSATLLALVTELLIKFAAHETDAGLSSGRNRHANQEKKNHSLATVEAPASVLVAMERLRDLKTKLNSHDADNSAHTSASLNQVTEIDGAIQSYVYAFHYHHSYVSDGETFEDFGPTVQVYVDGVLPADQGSISITGLTHVSNAGVTNYDAINTTIRIYRTVSGGTVPVKIGEVSPGVTVFTDTKGDGKLLDGEAIYTAGGVLDNDPPPSDATCVHIVGSVAYYAAKNILRQSVPFDYDACPIECFTEFPSDILTISSARNNPIVMTADGIYRIDGVFDELGRGGMVAQRLDTTVVCVSRMSVVQAGDTVYFAGRDGFYACDGFRVTKISTELDARYSNLVLTATHRSRIFGVFHQAEQRIYWSVQNGLSADEMNSIWVLDLSWGVRPNSTFTTWSGASSTFTPTALCVWDGDLLWGDSTGHILKFSDAYVSDLISDVAVADSSLWQQIEIPYHFRSMGTSFGSNYARKWVPQVVFILESDSDVSIQPGGINDDSGTVKKTSEIRVRQRFDWGDDTVVWSHSSRYIWNQRGVLQERRMFQGRQVRCAYKQVDLTNAYSNVAASDYYAVASVNAALKTAYIDPATEYSWPENIVSMDIYFEDDGYIRPYKILTRSATSVSFEDVDGRISLNGTRKWIIRGYPRNERFTILSQSLYFDVFSNTYGNFPGVTGGNAT